MLLPDAEELLNDQVVKSKVYAEAEKTKNADFVLKIGNKEFHLLGEQKSLVKDLDGKQIDEADKDKNGVYNDEFQFIKKRCVEEIKYFVQEIKTTLIQDQ